MVCGEVVEAVVSEMRDEMRDEVVGEVKDEVIGGVRDVVRREVSCCELLLELQFCIVMGWWETV